MKNLILIPVLLVIVGGCSTIDVDTDYDREADFSGYRTFDWAPADMMKIHKGYSELTDRRIRGAITEALAAEGIRRSPTNPGLLVAFHTGVQERTEYRDAGFGAGYGRGPYHVGLNRSRVEEHRYLEGTLMVDLVDAEKNELVWRGRATGVVGDYEHQESRIREAVTKIFERYPPEK
ncbi:MAG: DUF4136 domain-containing protein [Planctomycetota bacterium]